MEKMNYEGLDLIKTNINKLMELFPECVTDGKIDSAKLRPICYESVSHNYNVLGESVGKAFSDGKAVK